MPLSVRARLILLAATACVGLLIVGLLGFSQLRAFNQTMENSSTEIRNDVAALIAVGRADSAFKTQVQEWKNVLIRGNDPTLFDRYLDGFQKQEGIVRDHLAMVEPYLKASDPESTTIRTLLADHAALGTRYRAAQFPRH